MEMSINSTSEFRFLTQIPTESLFFHQYSLLIFLTYNWRYKILAIDSDNKWKTFLLSPSLMIKDAITAFTKAYIPPRPWFPC